MPTNIRSSTALVSQLLSTAPSLARASGYASMATLGSQHCSLAGHEGRTSARCSEDQLDTSKPSGVLQGWTEGDRDALQRQSSQPQGTRSSYVDGRASVVAPSSPYGTQPLVKDRVRQRQRLKTQTQSVLVGSLLPSHSVLFCTILVRTFMAAYHVEA